MPGKKSKQELLSHVYDDEESLVKAAALRWTVENLGQDWPEVNSFQQLLEMHMDGVDEDGQEEMDDGLCQEMQDWIDEARKHLSMLEMRGLPLTLANMELSFERKLP